MDGLESSELKNLSSVLTTDLTLEQIINADASSKPFGITSMTNLISARKTCTAFDFFQTTIISSLTKRKMEMCHSIFDMELYWNIIRYYIKLWIFCLKWWIHSTKLTRKDYITLKKGKNTSVDREEVLLSVNVAEKRKKCKKEPHQ